jgi:hypothetical protein
MPGHKLTVNTLMLAAAAICSLFAAHVVQYQLLVPDATARSKLLEQTGHGYLPWALRGAMVLGLLAAVSAGVLGYVRERGKARCNPSPLRYGLKLAGVQVGGFLALESVERIVAGAPADRIVWRALAITAGVQLLGAILATLVLVLIGSVGAAFARIPGSKLPPLVPDVVFGAPGIVEYNNTLWARPFTARGPPLLPTV